MAHDHPPPDDIVFECVEEALGAPVAEVIFTARHLSEVFGLRLGNDQHVVAKLRPAVERLTGCWEVQKHLWKQGYPAPEPLTGPLPLGEWALSIETYISGGELRVPGRIVAGDFATPLARLIELAPAPHEVAPLSMLPWLSSRSGRDQLWPTPDDVDADLNNIGGPSWIDEAATFARSRIACCDDPIVIGHGDWASHNLHWVGEQLHVVHDWDSVVAEQELVIVGVTAAFYPSNGNPESTATVDQTRDFLNAYAAARGRLWSSDDLEMLWAAGLWNRAFDAKKQVVEGRIRTLTEAEAQKRLRLARA